MLYEVEPGQVIVDYGPVYLNIRAESAGQAAHEAAVQGAQAAITAFEEVARFLEVAKGEGQGIVLDSDYPAVLQRMISAVCAVGDLTLTPLTAVAGAIADVAAEASVRQGADKVVVDNGGDISIRIEGRESVTVGIVTDLGHAFCSYRVRIDASSGIKGVATSGLRGRGLTKGIASAAVAFCSSGALADACATHLGNAANVDHPAVKRGLAEQIDPNTDIRGHRVVVGVGLLPEEACRQALTNGVSEIDRLIRKGILLGALIAVRGLLAVRGKTIERCCWPVMVQSRLYGQNEEVEQWRHERP